MFVEDKYCIDNHNFSDDLIQSFDESFYVCLTSHKKLLKKQILCQSVSSKLEVYTLPDSLKDEKL